MKLKKSLFLWVFIMAVFFAGTPVAKGQNTKLNIVGKWKVDKSSISGLVDDIIENVRKKDASQAETLKEQKEMIEQVVGETIFEYKENNTYTFDIPGRPQSTGTWKLSEDNKKIIRTDDKGKEIINEIVESTKTTLTIINSDKRKVIYNRQ